MLGLTFVAITLWPPATPKVYRYVVCHFVGSSGLLVEVHAIFFLKLFTRGVPKIIAGFQRMKDCLPSFTMAHETCYHHTIPWKEKIYFMCFALALWWWSVCLAD